ncbi:hypothetical protein [Siminovitchia terrae]|uniref:hypothetical protein n=1 Tax=Siminovitchia terrae TaxID=1914933 RepID=UPI0028AD1421|nr:hypothetical protein [Siminovitchia terrae]
MEGTEETNQIVNSTRDTQRRSERLNFIQQKSPTSVSGEMNAYWYSINEGSNPD